MTIDQIEERLRRLASYFTGTAMAGRISKTDHASWRLLGVTFVDDKGNDIDVGDELLAIADEVGMLNAPRVIE